MGRGGKKFRGGYLSVPTKNPSVKKTTLFRSFKVLEGLWASGVHPRNLQKHFFITWLVFAKGNVNRLSRLIKLHRNTVIAILYDWGIKSTYKIRVFQKEMTEKHPRKSIEDMVGVLYEKGLPDLSKPAYGSSGPVRYSKKIRARFAAPLNRAQNASLVKLWLSGFPFRGLRLHYVYWAAKKGLSPQLIGKTLGVGVRTLHRIRVGKLRKDKFSLEWLPKFEGRSRALLISKPWWKVRHSRSGEKRG